MSDKYEQIKNIFSDVLETEPLKEISIKDYGSKIDYIKGVYNYITKNKYADMKKDAIQFLGISHSKLDEFLIEIICSNLYCDLALILQIVGNKVIKHEYLIASLGIDGIGNKTTAERLRKRLQPDRMNKMEELRNVKDVGCVYYAPTVISAYKDTLFVNRAGTDILDISTIFIDVFKALFCETDEQTQNIRLIKAYRLWKFTPDTIHEVANIYQQVFGSENSYKYAEIIFLEKLFGLLTLNEILTKDFDTKSLIPITKGIAKMHSLGYSSMTQLIASKINYKNHHIFEDVIIQYIYPLCSECIAAILKDVITYMGRIEVKEREKLVKTLLNTCHNNTTQMYSKNLFENTKLDCVMDMFKAIFDLPDKCKTESERAEVLKIYLASLKDSYSYEDNIEGENKIVSVVNDISYENLSYAQNFEYTDDCLPLTEEDLKNYRRQKYKLV